MPTNGIIPPGSAADIFPPNSLPAGPPNEDKYNWLHFLYQLTNPELNNLMESQAFARNILNAKSGGYTTTLSPGEELAFQLWVLKNNVNFDPSEKTPDYDMRGFWQAMMRGHPKAITHSGTKETEQDKIFYPPEWETPYNANFSPSSIYWKK